MKEDMKIDAVLVGGEVNTRVRHEIPPDNETIIDDVDLYLVVKYFNRIDIYKRSEEACPFGRGNWVIDFYQNKGDPLPATCYKLPIEMEEEKFKKWVKPLVDKMNEHNKKIREKMN